MTTQYVRPTGDTSGVQDRTRIQTALTAGGAVVLNGTYYINAGLTISAANTSLLGPGPDTVLTCKTDDFVAITISGDYDRRVHVGGFRVQGGLNAVAVTGGATIPTQDVWIVNLVADDQASASVKFSKASDCHVDRLISNGALIGFEQTNESHRNVVCNSRITSWTQYGVYVHDDDTYGGHSLRVTDCTIMSGTGTGVMANSGMDYGGLVIRGCYIGSITGYGIQANHGMIRIDGNVIESCTLGGIKIAATAFHCYTPTITCNYFEENGVAAIQFYTANTKYILSPLLLNNLGSGTSTPLLLSTGDNMGVIYPTLIRDYYGRSGTGDDWYEVGATFSSAVIHGLETTRLSIAASSYGAPGYQQQIIPFNASFASQPIYETALKNWINA
jgi:hypothetical protein